MASHRRPSSSGLDRTKRVTVLSAAAASAAAALSAVPAGAQPEDPPSDAVSARGAVDRLYAQAERATELFNAAEERSRKLTEEVDLLRDRAARGQERVNAIRNALGGLAGAQYRSGGLDPAIALVLSESPDGYLDKASALERIGQRHAERLRSLRTALRGLRQQRTEAAGKLVELSDSRKAVVRHKRTVQRKLATAQRLLNALSPEERARFARASRHGRRADGGLLPFPDMTGSSPRAAAALAAARQAVGLPYAWGAAGPGAFDCSGLTQWAYGAAGVAIPRTSQAQRYAGRSVPLSQAQPGDLVVYRSDASHVGMYAGNGQVIHAPYPGAAVRYDPVGMMPISSVTRP
ncbi:NlpC/P60 family protein [Streptomyces sp. P1-3]|uniref:C40 family peptidase n=1 Tax=Streptomyces sp. P1-3 TaxID=3421658 RepID=UPI003D36D178